MLAEILLVIGIGIFSVLLIIGRKKYPHLPQALDAEQYPLRNLLPFGYLVMASSGYTHNTAYDKRLLIKLNELYGVKKGKDYLRIHWANQLTLGIMLLLIFGLIIVGMGEAAGKDIIFLGLIIPIIAVYFLNQEITQHVKKRKESIQIDFTEFLNKLILLLNAGMPVTRAWKKIVEESHRDTYFYKEIKTTLQAIEGGIPEAEAYESFANRCRIPEIFKFVTLLLQSMKKGSGEMVSVLWMLSNECWVMRKSRAKLLGEEAATKLLFPMMIMLLAIMLIVTSPAIWAFRGF